MHACINIILKKLHVIQLRKKSCNWIFFSSFLTRKQHACFQHHSHINCMLFRQEFKSCKLKIFQGFQLIKIVCIFTIFHTKKTASYQPRIRQTKWNFFCQFSNKKTVGTQNLAPYTHFQQVQSAPKLSFLELNELKNSHSLFQTVFNQP